MVPKSEPYDPSADELLAIRCQLGEPEAFDELVERWGARLRGYLLRVATDDAEDLVQEVWLRVLRGLPGLREPTKFRSWFFGIAHRVLIDRLRSRYADRVETGLEADDHGELDPAFARDINRELIDSGLATLQVPEREAIGLFYFEELSLAEISTTLGVPEGTVKSRLHRARASLRCHFDKQGENG